MFFGLRGGVLFIPERFQVLLMRNLLMFMLGSGDRLISNCHIVGSVISVKKSAA